MHIVKLILALVLAAPSAFACGGLFCDNTSRVPVDQSGETILFEVHGDGTISATVEIQYTGEAEDFAWVVPVPGVPDVELADPLALDILAGVGQVSIQAPNPRGEILQYVNCGDDDDDDDDDDGKNPDPVELLVSGGEGPFSWEVVGSTDADAMFDWLVANDYLLTEEMRPLISHYVDGGMNFLAVVMTPGSDVSQIAPLRMTYESVEPMVPLRLTAAAAEPMMAIEVIVLADQPYSASNWTVFQTDEIDLRADVRNNTTNFSAAVARAADQAGQAWVLQTAAALEEPSMDLYRMLRDEPPEAVLPEEWVDAGAWLQERLQAPSATHLTHLVSRISPWSMKVDPVLSAEPDREYIAWSVPGLGGAVFRDAFEHPTPDCAQAWCGVGGQCAVMEEGNLEGCVCPEGSAVRRVSSSSRQPKWAVTCAPLDFDPMGSVGGDMECPEDECQGGTCVLLGGTPACICPAGMGATEISGRLFCSEHGELYGPEQLSWPDWPPPVPVRIIDCGEDENCEPTPTPTPEDDDEGEDSASCGGCDVGGGVTPLALLLLFRRRRAPK